MGLKNSKADKKAIEESDAGDTDDESEILEILQEGDKIEDGNETQGDNFDTIVCKKKSLHDKYIPIKNLKLSHLEESIRHESVLKYVQLRAELVVQIKVGCSSMDRSTDESAKLRGERNCKVATGYAWIYCQEETHTKCPDPPCVENSGPHNVHRGIVITTNKHVVSNNEEAKAATVEFFYDSDDKNSKRQVVIGKGISLLEEVERKDYVSLKIYYHDEGLFRFINNVNEKIMKSWEEIPDETKLQFHKHAVVISHPHGKTKRVSMGKLCDMEVLDRKRNRRETRYTCQTCRGSSGAPVLTGLYWTKPFVHSSTRKDGGEYVGMSFTY